jgi:c-di-GMP-binding flagellar brake protein YcgR
MERRIHARIAHRSLNPIPVVFCGAERGTGTLYDVSPGGCKIDTRTTPALGTTISLKLAFSYKAQPIKIDAAVVGWTIKDKYFGVKFLDVKPTERLALDQYIASLAELAPLSLF